jgi:hypothetical protein
LAIGELGSLDCLSTKIGLGCEREKEEACAIKSTPASALNHAK